jgi:hypothetical protein
MCPGFHTKEGNEIGLNKAQKWLWECWEDAWKWFYGIAKKDDWTMIVNGDAIDGFHHHAVREIWTPDESEHGIAAYHVLKAPALKASEVYITEGTEVHTKGHEHPLAYQLKAKGSHVVMPEGQGGAWPTLSISFAGTFCKFDHHIGATTRPYLEASMFSISLGAVRTEYSRAGKNPPRVIVRSHRHRFGMFDDGCGMCIVTPPWQLLTRFGRKVVPEAIPQVGIVVLDWRERGDDELPDVKRRLYQSSPSPIING